MLTFYLSDTNDLLGLLLLSKAQCSPLQAQHSVFSGIPRPMNGSVLTSTPDDSNVELAILREEFMLTQCLSLLVSVAPANEPHSTASFSASADRKGSTAYG